jgi:predicted lipoprotein with Yx(FWY)xxD motif
MPVWPVTTSTQEVSMSNRPTPSTPSSHRRGRLLVAPVGFAALALALAACGGTTATSVPEQQPAVIAPAAAASAVLGTATTPLGTILVDAQGRTVYEFASDSKDTSTCSGQCLTYWPAVTAPTTIPKAIQGITATLGSLDRTDGGSQLTINGMPLYTYAADTAPGMTTGQGSNGSGAKWWVVAPDGTPITTLTPAEPATTSAPSSRGTATPPATNGY